MTTINDRAQIRATTADGKPVAVTTEGSNETTLSATHIEDR